MPFDQLNVQLKMPQECHVDTLGHSKSIVEVQFFSSDSSRNSISSSNVLLLLVTVVAAVLIAVAVGTFRLLVN